MSSFGFKTEDGDGSPAETDGIMEFTRIDMLCHSC
jgi:hypothetical protein